MPVVQEVPRLSKEASAVSCVQQETSLRKTMQLRARRARQAQLRPRKDKITVMIVKQGVLLASREARPVKSARLAALLQMTMLWRVNSARPVQLRNLQAKITVSVAVLEVPRHWQAARAVKSVQLGCMLRTTMLSCASFARRAQHKTR